jgi:hypothetical protein
MTAPRRVRLRSLRLVVGGVLVLQGLVWSAAAASADATPATTTALIQSSATVSYGAESGDTIGVTVTGQNGDDAPTGTVTVEDESGPVTVICTATLAFVAEDVSGATCSPGDDQFPAGTSLSDVVATYGGDADNAGSVSSPAQDFTVPTSATGALPPAPSYFASSLTNTYQSELDTAQVLADNPAVDQLGDSPQLETMAQFQTQVSQLDGGGLAEFYSLTQQVPGWTDIQGLMATASQDLTEQATQSAFITGPAKGARGRHTVADAVLDAFRAPGAGPRAASRAVLTGTPVAPAVQQQCPTAPPEAAIFALQIAIDVSQAVYNASSIIGGAQVLGVTVTDGADIAAIIAAVVIGVLQIVHDTLVYLQSLANDCANANLLADVANIDNTTIQIYGLATSNSGLIVDLQATQATTQQDVENIVHTGLSTFQTTLQEALTSDTNSMQATAGSNSQGEIGQMQLIQTALQSDIATVESEESTTGQQVVTGDTTIQTDLSAALTQILNETDKDAAGLTTLVTQDNQQILNTLQSESSMTQQQYDNLLRLQIEQALAGYGPVVPEAKFMLPVSQGGFLNATPVGVQEVVTTDLQAMLSIGAKVKPAAATDLAAGNAALAANPPQYVSAWSYFAEAYQALA